MVDVGSLEIGAPYFLLQHHAGDLRLPLIRTVIYTGAADDAFAFEDRDEDEPLVLSSEEAAQRVLDRAGLIARLQSEVAPEVVAPITMESLVVGEPYFLAGWQDREGRIPSVETVVYLRPGALDDGTPVCFFRQLGEEPEGTVFVYAADMDGLVCMRDRMIELLGEPPLEHR